MRAAANHVIQAPEATLVKRLECRIWAFQPAGIHNWRVQPLDIHDEIMAPTLPELRDSTQTVVDKFIDTYRKDVPLLDIEWSTTLKTWANK